MSRRSRKQTAASRASAPSARPEASRPRRAAWWHLLVLVAVTFAVYGNALGNGFVSDDDFQVLSNRLITDYHNLPKLFTTHVWAFAHQELTNYFRPLHMAISMAEYYAFGYDPLLWHLANLGFHVAALTAAYFLTRALAGETLAFWAALWFALHPIHVENVVWIAVLPDLLCGVAFFTGLLAYQRAREGHRPILFYAISTLCFFLSLLLKETGMVFPGLLLAYEFLYRGESPQAILRGAARYISFAAVFAVYLAMRLHALGKFAPATGTHFHVTPWEMFLSVPVLFAEYVWKLLVPVNLNYYYVYHPVRALGWQTIVSLLLIAGLVWAVFWLRRRQPLLSFSIAWFCLVMVPAMSITNVGENVFTERYLYIPSFGFCIIGSWTWLRVCKSPSSMARRTAAVALAALFLFYAAQIVRRNPDWKDDLTLFGKTAEQSPDSGTTIANLGYIHYLHGHVDESIEFYHRAIQLNPERALTHNNLGNSYSAKNQLDEAIASLRRAIELKPDYYSAWLNLGLVYAKKQDWDHAIECYQKSLELKPDFPEAWTALGLAQWSKKQPQDAIASYRHAVAANPEYVEAHINLASALSETGATDEAVEHLLTVLRLQPNGPYASIAHFNLGINYERKQMWKAAQVEYERALMLNPGFSQARQKVEYYRAKLPAEAPPQLPLSVPRKF
ncbi:MAG TPA: tetratricopeptide repeat protein [Candidatus Acidoferrales bacterium]|nr:tetratricopeptide repeat protein [Candidatus Acidoferrales bacterium]